VKTRLRNVPSTCGADRHQLRRSCACHYFDSFAPGDTVTVKFRLRAKYPIRARTFKSRVYDYHDPEVSSVARAVQLEVRKHQQADATTHPMLTALNRKSFSSSKVHIINADAFPWVDSSTDSFDFIVIDFPDPTNYSLGKLYTTAFYKAAARHLSAQGLMVVQSTSPMFARDSYWCIAETLKQARLKTYPYHVYVPSFGEWGFVIASFRDYQLPTSLPPGLRFVSVDGLPALFQFPLTCRRCRCLRTG
jgi:predicted membrane-bound spermidine synthase